MTGRHISAASTDFFIAAALLALFGLAALNQAGPHGPLQLVLAVVMAVAGFLLRSGTPEARLIGLGAAGLTVAVGAVLLVTGGYYLVGTVIAIFALFRLAATPAQVVAPYAGAVPPHLPAQLPPWSPGHTAPVPPPRPVTPAMPAPQAPAGQGWDYFGKPT